MQYSKGIQTKEAIYQMAKQLMRTHGYKHTTVSMIAKEANVPPGLVNYYFKKQELCESIFKEFTDSIEQLIQENAEHQPENDFQRHILQTKVIFQIVYNDKASKTLYQEIFKLNLFSEQIHQVVRDRQVKILRSFQVSVKPDFYYLCTVAEYGARRELLQLYEDMKPTDQHFKTTVELFSTIAVRIAGLPAEIIDNNTKKADEIFQTLNISNLRLL